MSSTMSTAVSPGSAGEALGRLRSAMGYLAVADATQMAAPFGRAVVAQWAR
jgi:hypothetical protein